MEQDLLTGLTARPERTAKELLADLQAHHPRQYDDHLLRTLQRRVRTWRTSLVLAFDTEWLPNDPLAAAVGLAPAVAPVDQEARTPAVVGR